VPRRLLTTKSNHTTLGQCLTRCEMRLPVRSERSRVSSEVEECACGRGTGLRLRYATLRPNGDRTDYRGAEVYKSHVVRFSADGSFEVVSSVEADPSTLQSIEVDGQPNLSGTPTRTISQGQVQTVTLPVENTPQATFLLAWSDPISDLGLALVAPDGTRIDLDFAAANPDAARFSTVPAGENLLLEKFYVIPHPVPGNWTFEVTGQTVSSPQIGFLALAIPEGGVVLTVGPLKGAYDAGEQALFSVQLTENGIFSVLDANVQAVVSRPDGSTDTVALFDDGLHGDGSVDDGLYGNHYLLPAGLDGTYVLSFSASGSNASGEPFSKGALATIRIAQPEDADEDGFSVVEGDCDDNDPDVYPGATEVCNGVDDNCNDQIDEGVKSTFYRDADGDGYGLTSDSTQVCSAPAGYVADNTDCNDANAAIHPGVTETCNNADDNCDGQIDEGVKSTFYRDADGDGYGIASDSTQACSAPAGYVTNNTDCNDGNGAVRPGATEVCNEVDDDCDGQIDEGLTCGVEIFSASFTTDSDNCTYVDDTFRGTSRPLYAAGDHATTGGFAGGGVHVVVGNVDGATISGMSGGWRRTFTLNTTGTVRVSLKYRLVVDLSYDTGECGQALVALDGTLLGADTQNSLRQFCGANPNVSNHQDSGWQPMEFEVPGVGAGAHTLTVGGWNNQKNSKSEKVDVFFDDIELRAH